MLATLVAVAAVAGCVGPAPSPGPSKPYGIYITTDQLVNGTGYEQVMLNNTNRSAALVDADVSPDGATIALGFSGGGIELWSSGGQLLQSFSVANSSCHAHDPHLRFLNDTALVGTCRTLLRAFDLSGALHWQRSYGSSPGGSFAYIEDMEVSASGEVVAIRYPQPYVEVWNRTSGLSIWLTVVDGHFRSVALSADGTVVGTGGTSVRFFRVDFADNSSALVNSLQSDAKAEVSANGSFGLGGLSMAGYPPVRIVNETSLLLPNQSWETFSAGGPRVDSEPAYTYEGGELYVSPSGQYVAWVDIVKLMQTTETITPDSHITSSGYGEARRLVVITDRTDLTRPLGFEAGGNLSSEDFFSRGNVVRVILHDDGSALAFTAAIDTYDPPGDYATSVTMTRANAGALAPVKGPPA